MRGARWVAVHALLGLAALTRVASAETAAPPGLAHALPSVAASPVPFVDFVAAANGWAYRPSSTISVGGQAGLFIAQRLRLSARLVFPTTQNSDVVFYDPNLPPDSSTLFSKPYSLLYGAALGIVAVSSESFALSPGVAFTRSNVSDYGSMLGLSAPVEWVNRSGMRTGFELDVGRVFGGSYAFTCLPIGTAACPDGAQSRTARPSGAAIWLQFTVGYGFGH